MQIPNFTDSIQQLGQSFNRASQNVIDTANIYRKVELDNQVAKASILMKERMADKMLEFQNTAFQRDEKGEFNYKGFGEKLALYSTELWNKELSLVVTDPLGTERVHQAFNEFVVDQQGKLKIQAANWMRDEQAYNFTQNVEDTVLATSLTATEKRDAVLAMVVANRDAGILDPAAAQESIDKAYYAIGINEAQRMSASMSYEDGRAFLGKLEGIKQPDRGRLISNHDSNERRRKAVEAELLKENQEAQMQVAQENAWEKGMSGEQFLELTKPGGPFEDLDAGQQRIVMNIIDEEIREREDDSKRVKTTTNEIVTNMIEVWFMDKNQTRESLLEKLYDLLPEKGQIGPGNITGDDIKKYIKRLDEKVYMRLNDTATKEVIATLDQAVKDGIITEAEKEREADEHYRWMGQGRWDSERFVNDTAFTDEEKLQRIQNRLKPKLIQKVSNALRRNWDPAALSQEERAHMDIMAGELYGTINFEGQQEVMRRGTLATPADVERILAGGKKPSEMTAREKTMYESNVRLANLIQKQGDLFSEEFGVHREAVEVELEGTGRPVFVVEEEKPEYRHADGDIPDSTRYEKAYYAIKIENKDEVWYKWNSQLDAWLPHKTGTEAREEAGVRVRIIQQPTKRQDAINELRPQIRAMESQIRNKKAAIGYKPGMTGGQADLVLELEQELEGLKKRMEQLRAAEAGK